MIDERRLGAQLAALQGITGGGPGVTRLAWTRELAEAERWFEAEAERTGLRVERDPAGNLWACPEAEPPWWGVGSHLDSVRCGGAYDGALGVAAGFEIARAAAVPVAVLSFADEEGARFNTPTFGSRALAGRLDLPHVLERRDADGVPLGDALAQAGVDPERVGEAPGWLDRLSGFLELHIDQSREVARLGVPAAAVSGLAARRRVRVELVGRADHAGATPMDERRDALAAAARLIVAVTEPRDGVRAAATRIVVEPNALSTIPERATVWLDVRAESHEAVAEAVEWLASERLLAEAGAVDGARSVVESAAPATGFDPRVRAALREVCAQPGRPAGEVLSYAGHDAGILAERLPAGMLFVRNASGVSHAPEEHVELGDAAWAAESLRRALEALA